MEKKKIFTRQNVFRISMLLLAFALFFGAALSSYTSISEAKNIIKGDTKENVRMVQQKLSELGYYKIKVDGVWGNKTREAVINFQKAKGIKADGIIGAQTEKALGINLGGSNSGSGGNSSSSSSGQLSTSDLNLLAKCVHAEARGEPYTGQVAVAAVVLNRVKSSKFPNSVSGVIYQPLAFTCVADGQINLAAGETAMKAAKDALNGWDPTNGCLYYYNPATATSKWIWSLKVELKIGRHSFARG